MRPFFKTAFAALFTLSTVGHLHGQELSRAEQMDLLKTKIDNTVELRQDLAETREDWQFERDLLQRRREAMREEMNALSERLKELQEATDTTADERLTLEQRREELITAAKAVGDVLDRMEARTKEIVKRLPQPVQNQVRPLTDKMPKNEQEKAKLSLGARLQNIVGVLSVADQYNRNINLESEIQTFDGKEINMRILYWGLGAAYAVDQNAQYASIGHPTPDGWAFEPAPEAAEEISLLVKIFEGGAEIQFVPVKATIQ